MDESISSKPELFPHSSKSKILLVVLISFAVLFFTALGFALGRESSQIGEKKIIEQNFKNLINDPPLTPHIIGLTVTPEPTGTSNVSQGCEIGGCSGELCVDEGSDEIYSICIYREEFACTKLTTCERQPNGACGWTETPEYNQCLAKYQTPQSNPSNPPDCGPGYEAVCGNHTCGCQKIP